MSQSEYAKNMARRMRRHPAALGRLAKIALPCPFCGKPPTLGPTRPDVEGNAFGFVACENKRCAVNPQARDGSQQADERGSAAYIALAVRRWNRRAA